MSRRGSILMRLVGVLLLVGVLFAVGALAFQAGQAQGYAWGLAVSGQESAAVQPGAPGIVPGGMPGYGYYARPFFGFAPMGPFLGLLCLGGLGLVFLFALGAIFRPRHWGSHSDHWHGWHGGPPPWAKETPQEPTGPAEEPT